LVRPHKVSNKVSTMMMVPFPRFLATASVVAYGLESFVLTSRLDSQSQTQNRFDNSVNDFSARNVYNTNQACCVFDKTPIGQVKHCLSLHFLLQFTLTLRLLLLRCIQPCIAAHFTRRRGLERT